MGGRIAVESVAFTDWAFAAGKLEGEREGGDRNAELCPAPRK